MSIPREAQRDLPRSNLMQRYGQARDVADAVTYLAGPSGAFVTGEVMVVDGGNQGLGRPMDDPTTRLFQARRLSLQRG